MEKLKMRNEVDPALTWDLSLIYKDKAALEADVEKMQTLASQIEEAYKGRLDTPEVIVECLDKYEKLVEIMTLVENYTYLAVEVDYYNEENQVMSARCSSIIYDIQSRLSFIDSEISVQSEEVLGKAVDMAKGPKNYLKDVVRNKPHMMHPEAERVYAAMAHTINAPFETYNMIKLADIKFDDFEVNGRKYPLGYSLFEDTYEYEPDTEVRRAAFNAFSKKIKEYENGTACAYNAHVQQVKTESELRGFETIEDLDLFKDKVTREMYDRQIDVIMEKLAPHMRKYARLLKRVYGLEKMTFADLKLSVDPDYCPPVTIAQAREYVEKGLSVMGEDYNAMIKEAFRDRWIDFAQNQGKSTGGFCASPYGANSYILMSWNGKMADVFTLAHELGHAGHFKMCNEAQSVFDTEVSTYFVEAPSTMNEILMAHYMLKTNDDPRFRRWVLSEMISNAYYHNFVTHLLEAAYQREVYKIAKNGDSLQADTLSRIFREVLEKFWGDDVEIVEGAELTWMRQPHYYMGLYSYTYSAGLTVATQMCKRIESEGKTAVEDWKRVLTAGSTLDPVSLAALGGIDITTDEALLDTIETIGSYIDEICDLTDIIEKQK